MYDRIITQKEEVMKFIKVWSLRWPLCQKGVVYKIFKEKVCIFASADFRKPDVSSMAVEIIQAIEAAENISHENVMFLCLVNTADDWSWLEMITGDNIFLAGYQPHMGEFGNLYFLVWYPRECPAGIRKAFSEYFKTR